MWDYILGFNLSPWSGSLTLATVARFWFQFLAGAEVSGWRVVLLFPCRVWFASGYITLGFSVSLRDFQPTLLLQPPYLCAHPLNCEPWPSSNRLGRNPLDWITALLQFSVSSCPNLLHKCIYIQLCFVTEQPASQADQRRGCRHGRSHLCVPSWPGKDPPPEPAKWAAALQEHVRTNDG